MADSDDLLKSLGVHIAPETLRLALTHRSFAYENHGIPTNERLEFLGDSVLGFAVTDYLYRTFSDLPEGDLAKLRAALVSTRALARIARSLDLGPHIRLGEGEVRTHGAQKDSILADTMEALIGAAYLSTSLEVARSLVLRLVVPLLSDKAAMTAGKDWKTTVRLDQLHHLRGGAGPQQILHRGADHRRPGSRVRVRPIQEGGRTRGRPCRRRGTYWR